MKLFSHKFFFSIFIFLFISLFVIPSFAQAHPLDELGNVKVYDEKQILTIDKKLTELKIEMQFFAYEKTLVWESIDTNKDREISSDEKNNWMELGKDSSWIVFNGKKYNFEPKQVILSDYYTFFSPPPTRITLIYTKNISLPQKGSLDYFYNGRDKKITEIQLEIKGSNNLTPLSTKKIPPDRVSVIFGKVSTLRVDESINPLLEGGSLKTGDRLQNFLNRYIKPTEEIPLSLKLWAIAIAFSIGALHALTPGHGKGITASFLIGERGTLLQALYLGLIITITHTSSVFLLGLGALLLTQYIVPDTVIRWLNFFSGLLVLGFGLYLIYIRSKKIPFFSTLRVGKSINALPEGVHSHNHEHLSLKTLLPLGISGGIVPCVDALAILIVAVSLNKILFGIILLLSFSLGLASVLIAGGILVVVAKNKAAKKFRNISRIEPYLSLTSAIIVTVLGIALLLAFLK